MAIRLQKADLWKRISAYLLDVLIIFIVAVASTLVFMSAFKYDSYLTKLADKQAAYELEYGIDLNISQEDYNNLSPADKQAYDEKYTALNDALTKDKEVAQLYTGIATVCIVSIALGLLVANGIVYFAIPLFFKNGQTLGKKCFGLAVVRSNAVKISTPVLFARTFIGQYAIETLFPMFLLVMTVLGFLGTVGLVTLGMFVVLEVIVMIMSHTNSTIHDLLSDTVVVDLASQEIFQSYEALVEHQKAEAAKKASETDYV